MFGKSTVLVMTNNPQYRMFMIFLKIFNQQSTVWNGCLLWEHTVQKWYDLLQFGVG